MTHSLRKHLLVISAALATLTAFSASADDLTIVETVRAGKSEKTSTRYLTPGQTRQNDGETDTIADIATGRVIVINHAKKEYYETSPAEADARVERLPASVRKMLGADGGQPVSVQTGAATRKIAGYDCAQYILRMGEDVMEVWTTEALESPTREVDTMSGPWTAMGPVVGRFKNLFAEMKKIKGVHLATRMTLRMRGQTRIVGSMKTIDPDYFVDSLTEATEVRLGPIPAAAFAVPAGYRKVASPYAR